MSSLLTSYFPLLVSQAEKEKKRDSERACIASHAVSVCVCVFLAETIERERESVRHMSVCMYYGVMFQDAMLALSLRPPTPPTCLLLPLLTACMHMCLTDCDCEKQRKEAVSLLQAACLTLTLTCRHWRQESQ